MSMRMYFMLAGVLAFLLLAGPLPAAGLEEVQFLKISPRDHTAVMKTAEGGLQLVGEGDVIDDARVAEIAEGRIVLEKAGETVIFRLDGKHQRIERIRTRGEKAPPMLKPGNLRRPSDLTVGNPRLP